MAGQSQLPPWEPRGPLQKRQMTRWAFDRIDERLARDTTDMSELDYATRVARATRDVTMLRQIYPEIADFIHPPERKRGERGRDTTTRDLRDFTKVLAGYVRDAWKEHYGRRNRTASPTALDIAIEYANAHARRDGEKEITTAMLAKRKPSGKKKPRPASAQKHRAK